MESWSDSRPPAKVNSCDMVGRVAPLIISRRSFLATSLVSPLCLKAKPSSTPVGLELYSVRDQLKADLPGTLKEVASDGYTCVEFFATYHDWTIDAAKDVRKRLDDLNLRCYSTHNHLDFLEDASVGHTVELNHAIGSKYIVVASPGKPITLDDWKSVAEKLNGAATKLESQKLFVGYHNHDLEFRPLEGVRPMEVLARQTRKEVMLQLDVGTCLEAGSDPVAWIKQNQGRIRSMHCKDWSKQQGYEVLLGEGVAPWKQIFEAAEGVGGLEYYLIEQEGSRYSPFDTAKRCLVSFRKLHNEAT